MEDEAAPLSGLANYLDTDLMAAIRFLGRYARLSDQDLRRQILDDIERREAFRATF